MKLITKLYNKISFQIELISQILLVVVSAGCYGVIEAAAIPTDTGQGNVGWIFKQLPGIFSQWSYYHILMLILLSTSGFSLAWAHVQWMLTNKKRYIGFVCGANFILMLLLEDITWFIVRWKAIARDEWTCMKPGWCINAGFTYIPYWYIVALVASIGLYILANKYAAKGYAAKGYAAKSI